mmetsp:Transcript_22675/g.68045  ORF Transcript_22675/g.68045 Transcript_22675/m.68045 type:complete len:177 (+) Transcript_22675:317-847(+)
MAPAARRLLPAFLLLACSAGFAPTRAPRTRKRAVAVRATPLQKRCGDAMVLASLSIYQQALRAPWAADVTIDVGGACIRGCRIAFCLFVAEGFFRTLRQQPPGQVGSRNGPELAVPIEAAGLSLIGNLGLEYAIASLDYVPTALAHSLGGTPLDVAVAYLTIVAWRIVYASVSTPR